MEYNSPNGQTSLHKAAYIHWEFKTVVEYLVEQFYVVDDIRDNHGNTACLQMIREAYLQLAKVHHPDVSNSNSMKQWNIILDAYQLL